MRQKLGSSVAVHVPARHAETVHEGPPLPHRVPSTAFDHALVLTEGWHVWQALNGFTAPAATQLPAMVQLPATGGWVQAPDAQTLWWQEIPSLAQAAPSGEGDHDVALAAGLHDRQSMPGSTAPAGWHTPPMRHAFGWSACLQAPARQVSAVQGSPSSGHALPSATTVNAVVDSAGWHAWQALVGFGVPAATQAPAMRQLPPASGWVQAPEAQTLW
jgi:hypothetical protein